MTITIKNDEVEKLAREASRMGGVGLTEIIRQSLEARLLQLKGRRTAANLKDEILAISDRCSELPDLDTRPEEEILGYENSGVSFHGH